jgi:hypothetical protein
MICHMTGYNGALVSQGLCQPCAVVGSRSIEQVQVLFLNKRTTFDR